jgi:hypothetical protein
MTAEISSEGRQGVYLQQYTALSVEKQMNKARFDMVPFMRKRESVTAAIIDIVYFPPLTRCGKMFLVSL